MLAFAIRRVLLAIIAFFVLTYAVWLLTTKEGIFALHHLSLDALIPVRYQAWLSHVLHGDLGYSIRAQQPVLQALRDDTKVTLLLIIPAFIIQEVVAIGIGLLSGARYRSAIDRTFNVVSFIGVAAPSFWLALVVVEFVAVQWQLLPVSGLVNFRVTGASFDTPEYWAYFHANTLQAITDIARHLILPVSVLAFTGIAADSQFVRLTLVEVLNQDYIRSAKARGLPQRTILWKHALRNTLVPLLTNIGLQLPRLVFAASLIELIFSLPGIGHLFASAVYTPPAQTPRGSVRLPKDYTVVTAYFLVLGIVALLSSMLTDFLYASADPRIRAGAAAQPFIANPYTSRQPLVQFGRVRVTVSYVTIAITVIVAGIVGVRAYQAYHQSPPPAIDGIWVGTVAYSDLPAQTAMFMNIQVNAQGTITGNSTICQYVSLTQTSNNNDFRVNGTTDRETINLSLTSQMTSDQYILFSGDYPLHSAIINLKGQYVVFGNARNATMMLERGTQEQFQRACAQITPVTPTPTP